MPRSQVAHSQQGACRHLHREGTRRFSIWGPFTPVGNWGGSGTEGSSGLRQSLFQALPRTGNLAGLLAPQWVCQAGDLLAVGTAAVGQVDWVVDWVV